MKVSEQLLLLSKGYTRKEIEALKEQEAKEMEESVKDQEPEKVEEPKKDPEPETDYKKLYDELKAQTQKNEADLKELQKANRYLFWMVSCKKSCQPRPYQCSPIRIKKTLLTQNYAELRKTSCTDSRYFSNYNSATQLYYFGLFL